MPVTPVAESGSRINPLGLWFCGLAALGYLRFFAKLLREPAAPLDGVAWLWLGGSAALSLLGIALLVHAWRKH